MLYPNYGSVNGNGLVDSFISAVTSQAAKEVGKKVAEKTLTEIGNRASQKVVDKIIPPKKRGKGLNKKSKNILETYVIPIEEYVKK